MDAWEVLDEWLDPDRCALRYSTQAEYRREVTSWLRWCEARRPRVDPWRVGPVQVAAWCEEEFLRPYLPDEMAFDGPQALAWLAVERPEVARSHDRRITALLQFYLAAQTRGRVKAPPGLHDLRSQLSRAATDVRRLDARERAAFLAAVGGWGRHRSRNYLRDQLLAYLLLEGLRPAQAVRLDVRLMTEQPDGGYVVRVPDATHDGPGREVSLDPLTGAAVKAYLAVRPQHPGVHVLLVTQQKGPLNSREPNVLVRAIADTSPLLAGRVPPVTADVVAHTGLWDAPAAQAESGEGEGGKRA